MPVVGLSVIAAPRLPQRLPSHRQQPSAAVRQLPASPALASRASRTHSLGLLIAQIPHFPRSVKFQFQIPIKFQIPLSCNHSAAFNLVFVTMLSPRAVDALNPHHHPFSPHQFSCSFPSRSAPISSFPHSDHIPRKSYSQFKCLPCSEKQVWTVERHVGPCCFGLTMPALHEKNGLRNSGFDGGGKPAFPGAYARKTDWVDLNVAEGTHNRLAHILP